MAASCRIFCLKCCGRFKNSTRMLSQARGRVFSGIQPTGGLHLGNLFGSVRRWVELQESGSECIYSIVDLHSITMPQDPKTLRANIKIMTASLLACGIDPTKSVLFLQSQVPEHTELCWILGCLLTMNRLDNFPQFKEKSSTVKEVPLGLYLYPVLQSADILLYKANCVPVGEDQSQHVNLARNLAEKFNRIFGRVFDLPKPLLYANFAGRIRSLRTPDKKMSKSESDPRGRIELRDSPETVREKFKKAMTDFTSTVTYDPSSRPGVSNLVALHALVSGRTHEDICESSVGTETARYKMEVAEAVVGFLAPIQERTEALLADHSCLTQMLEEGSDKARKIASATLQQVKEAVGTTCGT